MRNCGVVDIELECHMLLTRGFQDSNRVFDIEATVLQLTTEAIDTRDAWPLRYRESEGLAGVMLFICSGRKYEN